MYKNKKIFILFFLLLTISYSKEISWKQVFHADNDAIFIGIDNPDSNYCMAIATNVSYKEIVKSTDGGETWFHVFKDSGPRKWKKYAEDISYPSRDFCIIGLDSNSFLKTTDGGITWNEYKIDLPYRLFGFDDVDMFDENHGVMKNQHYLAISHDGFQTWETMLAPEGYSVFNIEMASPYSICVLSDDLKARIARFFRSDDGGKTWVQYPPPDYRYPQALQFVDSLIGYVVAVKGTGLGDEQYELVYKTTDGGRTWDKVLDTVIWFSFGLQKLDFYDKDNGIVVGQFGSVFWTHDGGKSWVFDSSGLIWDNIPATMNVCYIRKDRAIIADFRGRIFISEDTTTDVAEEIPNNDDFVLYPNPATDKIKIKFKDDFINTREIQIFNSYSEEIENLNTSHFPLTTNHSPLFEVDVSMLSAGVYFAVVNENGRVLKKPFVVMR